MSGDTSTRSCLCSVISSLWRKFAATWSSYGQAILESIEKLFYCCSVRVCRFFRIISTCFRQDLMQCRCSILALIELKLEMWRQLYKSSCKCQVKARMSRDHLSGKNRFRMLSWRYPSLIHKRSRHHLCKLFQAFVRYVSCLLYELPVQFHEL